jgi:hypothetical protein
MMMVESSLGHWSLSHKNLLTLFVGPYASLPSGSLNVRFHIKLARSR